MGVEAAQKTKLSDLKKHEEIYRSGGIRKSPKAALQLSETYLFC